MVAVIGGSGREKLHLRAGSGLQIKACLMGAGVGEGGGGGGGGGGVR
jgi:hypothetical protein